MWSPVCLAQEMGKELGRSEILLQEMRKPTQSSGCPLHQITAIYHLENWSSSCQFSRDWRSGLLNSLARELMILRAFCVLIALSMGAVYPALAKVGQTSSELSASEFSLPNGTLQIICFGNGDAETENAAHCDNCLLTGNPLVHLAASNGIRLPLLVKIGKVQTNIHAINFHDFLMRKQSRAPPLV